MCYVMNELTSSAHSLGLYTKMSLCTVIEHNWLTRSLERTWDLMTVAVPNSSRGQKLHKLSWSEFETGSHKDKVPFTHTQTPMEFCQGSHFVCELISDKVSGRWPLLTLHVGDGHWQHMAALQCFSANTSSLSAGPSQLWTHSLSHEALKHVGYEQCSSAVSFASIIRTCHQKIVSRLK